MDIDSKQTKCFDDRIADMLEEFQRGGFGEVHSSTSFSISNLEKVELGMRKFLNLTNMSSLSRALSEEGYSRSTVNRGTPDVVITFTKRESAREATARNPTPTTLRKECNIRSLSAPPPLPLPSARKRSLSSQEPAKGRREPNGRAKASASAKRRGDIGGDGRKVGSGGKSCTSASPMSSLSSPSPSSPSRGRSVSSAGKARQGAIDSADTRSLPPGAVPQTAMTLATFLDAGLLCPLPLAFLRKKAQRTNPSLPPPPASSSSSFSPSVEWRPSVCGCCRSPLEYAAEVADKGGVGEAAASERLPAALCCDFCARLVCTQPACLEDCYQRHNNNNNKNGIPFHPPAGNGLCGSASLATALPPPGSKETNEVRGLVATPAVAAAAVDAAVGGDSVIAVVAAVAGREADNAPDCTLSASSTESSAVASNSDGGGVSTGSDGSGGAQQKPGTLLQPDRATQPSSILTTPTTAPAASSSSSSPPPSAPAPVAPLDVSTFALRQQYGWACPHCWAAALDKSLSWTQQRSTFSRSRSSLSSSNGVVYGGGGGGGWSSINTSGGTRGGGGRRSSKGGARTVVHTQAPLLVEESEQGSLKQIMEVETTDQSLTSSPSVSAVLSSSVPAVAATSQSSSALLLTPSFSSSSSSSSSLSASSSSSPSFSAVPTTPSTLIHSSEVKVSIQSSSVKSRHSSAAENLPQLPLPPPLPSPQLSPATALEPPPNALEATRAAVGRVATKGINATANSNGEDDGKREGSLPTQATSPAMSPLDTLDASPLAEWAEAAVASGPTLGLTLGLTTTKRAAETAGATRNDTTTADGDAEAANKECTSKECPRGRMSGRETAKKRADGDDGGNHDGEVDDDSDDDDDSDYDDKGGVSDGSGEGADNAKSSKGAKSLRRKVSGRRRSIPQRLTQGASFSTAAISASGEGSSSFADLHRATDETSAETSAGTKRKVATKRKGATKRGRGGGDEKVLAVSKLPQKARKKEDFRTAAAAVLVGCEVRKFFGGEGSEGAFFRGRVASFDSPYFQVCYEDGDEEEMAEPELRKRLVEFAEAAAAGQGAQEKETGERSSVGDIGGIGAIDGGGDKQDAGDRGKDEDVQSEGDSSAIISGSACEIDGDPLNEMQRKESRDSEVSTGENRVERAEEEEEEEEEDPPSNRLQITHEMASSNGATSGGTEDQHLSVGKKISIKINRSVLL